MQATRLIRVITRLLIHTSNSSDPPQQYLRRRFQEIDSERFAYFLADLWDEYLDWHTRVLGRSRNHGLTTLSTNGRVLQIIRSKHYGSGKTISASEVKEETSLYNHDYDIDTVFIVTTGEFTDEAWQTITEPEVVLVDIDVLLTLIDDLDAEQLVAAYIDDIGSPTRRGSGFRIPRIDVGKLLPVGFLR